MHVELHDSEGSPLHGHPNGLFEAIRKSSIELVLTRHEQAAALMTATYGRLTGKPGVCITTLGPGALNLTPGAAYALLGHDHDHDYRL